MRVFQPAVAVRNDFTYDPLLPLKKAETYSNPSDQLESIVRTKLYQQTLRFLIKPIVHVQTNCVHRCRSAFFKFDSRFFCDGLFQ